MRIPQRADVENALRGLIETTRSREDVTDWATRCYLDDSVRINDTKVKQALYHLTGADTPTTDRPYLYEKEDFEAWLAELVSPEETA